MGSGNIIECDSKGPLTIGVKFEGSGNRIRISKGCQAKQIYAHFPNDDGCIEIGKVSRFVATLICAHRSRIIIGDGISAKRKVVVIAAEGATISIGSDCMIARDVVVRSDDAHAIYDVVTGRRVNKARDIDIGSHVWLANEAVILGGAKIGSGSVIGWRSIVKGTIPNNCVAAGAPAVVKKRNIAWERPHLYLSKPWEKGDLDPAERPSYWRMTDDF